MNATDTPDTECHNRDRDEKRGLAHLLAYVPRSAARVLDCTGELGGRGTLLKSHGAQEVFGLLDAGAGAPGAEGYDAIAQGPLDFVDIPDGAGPYDCILCCAALERLRNPDAFLARLLPHLAPGGLFLAVVPNMQYHKIVCALALGRWVYGDDGVWDRKNLRFYTGHEFRALLGRRGVTNCRVASLVKDEERAFPRDDKGYARAGKLRIGPLSDAAYQAWLTEYFLALAVMPARHQADAPR